MNFIAIFKKSSLCSWKMENLSFKRAIKLLPPDGFAKFHRWFS